MVSLYVTDRTKLSIANRQCLEDVDILGKAATFYDNVCKKFNVSGEEIVLVYRGKCLKNDESLESYSIKAGVTVHMLRRPQSQASPNVKKELPSSEIEQLVIALRTAVLRPEFKNTIRNLSKPEVLENLIAVTPGLAADSIAIAMLQDADLLTILTDPANIHRLVEAHPCLADAFNYIAASIHESGSDLSASSAAANSAAYSYSLDLLSDEDDEEEVDQSGNEQQPITSAQLASALAAVAAQHLPLAGSSAPQTPTPGPQTPGTYRAGPSTPQARSTPSQNLSITPEVLSQAVISALSSVQPPPAQAVVTQQQLQQLRDMGISDDNLSRQALQMTGGDIQAALELIFGDLGGGRRFNSQN